VFRYPLPCIIQPTAPHFWIIRGWYNRPNGAAYEVDSVLSQPTNIKILKGLRYSASPTTLRPTL
jgi:hypothetical protein